MRNLAACLLTNRGRLKKMNENENYESHRNRYLQAMFGEGFFEDDRPDRRRVKKALNRAHEIRQFEIRLYWQRSLFFWGFVLTLFGVLGLMLTAKKPTSLTNFMPVVIAPLGFFTTCAWYYVEKGSKAWMANWELHIDYLEDDITGQLYKTRLWLDGKKYNFFSASKITQTVIFAFGIFWLLTSVFVTLNALLTKKQERMLYSTFDPHFQCIIEFFEDCPWISVITSISIPFVIFMVVCFLACRKKCWLLGHWRTGDNKKLSDEDKPSNNKKPSDSETVIGSQRERKFELEN